MLKNNTPVLLIAFNRPETTKIVFDKIRELQPEKLFIAIDGPRTNRRGEKELCNEVHALTKKIDWSCDAKYRVREINLGCRNGVVDAISWVLKEEDRVIIIEDDVVPELNFFHFADELLEYYKNDEQIGMISANNYTPLNDNTQDYYFSKYAHIWGWATWKRFWNDFDVDCPDMEISLNRKNFYKVIINKEERRYFRWFFNFWLDKKKDGLADAWGPFLFFHLLFNNYYSIVPKYNLAKNIGVEGLHTIRQSNKHYWPTNATFKLAKHPKQISHSVNYDKNHFIKHINEPIPPNIIVRVIRKLKSLIS